MNNQESDDPVLERLRHLEDAVHALESRIRELEGAPEEAPPEEIAPPEAPLDLSVDTSEDATPIPSTEIVESLKQKLHTPASTPPPIPKNLVEQQKLAEEIHVQPPEPEPPTEQEDVPEPSEEWVAPESTTKVLLRRLNLLPPTEGGNLEIQVGTWWATRIGALFAVICGVFFAIYVSQNAAPWVRFAELVAGALGMTVLGLWLEKKIEKFGGVIFAAGLALLYFTAYAAYAVPAVRVVHHPALATSLQFVAAMMIIGCAIWRSSSSIATMAVVFGYLSCFFSITVDLENYALFASSMLGLGSAYLYIKRRWHGVFQAAILLSYLVYLVTAAISWYEYGRTPSFWTCHAYLLSYLLLYMATDFVAVARGQAMPATMRKLTQIANTTGAVVLGFLVTYRFFYDQLSTFYFLYGAILVAAFVFVYLRFPNDALMHVYFVKGTALITFGIITEFDARTRWMTLAVQSIILLFSARKTRLRVVEAAMALVWFVSVGFFLHDLYELGYVYTPAPLLSKYGLLALAYIAVSCVMLCLQARWLDTNLPTKGELPTLLTFATERDILGVFYAVILGITALVTAHAYAPHQAFPTLAIGLAAGVMAFTWIGRHWIPCVAGAIPLIAAHAFTWRIDDKAGSVTDAMSWGFDALYVNTWAVVLVTIAIALVLHARFTLRVRDVPAKVRMMLDLLLHGLWMLTLCATLYKTMGFESYLYVSSLLALTVAAIAVVLPFYMLANLSIIPLLLALGVCGASILGVHIDLPREHIDGLLWATLVAVYGYAISFTCIDKMRARLRFGSNPTYAIVHTILATLAGLFVLHELFDGEMLMLAASAAALVTSLLTRWPGLRPALVAAIAYTAASHYQFYMLVDASMLNTPTALWLSVLVAVNTVLYAMMARRLMPGMDKTHKRFIQWTHGGAALFLSFMLFYVQEGRLENYITVLWGVSAIVLFLLGWTDRTKAFRILGLVGIALCIPRVFLVDIQSNFYRIIAFGALGGVLLFVGFIYHKFQDVIARVDEEE